MDSPRKASAPLRNTTDKRHSYCRGQPKVDGLRTSSPGDLLAQSKPAGATSAVDKRVEDRKTNEKKGPESTIFPKRKFGNIPTLQTTTPSNNDKPVPQTRLDKLAPTSLELKQKDIIIYERAEMWAFAAQHMRPEPITLEDMELEDDAWAYDKDNKGISGAVSATPEAPGMDATVQALARGVWMTVYGVGKSVQFVSGGGYL
ncbi:hypothetical protein GE09DRAFT_1255717 [Coniochaeta sp. 2T2.1]|nr:hypothetical protein GE09DRAFT_1255717 [Coniochaeta sp. 2T2.1]